MGEPKPRTTFATDHNVEQARAAVRANGCHLIERAYSRAECDDIAAWMDGGESIAGVEINYGGSELRIWDAERHSGPVREFARQSDAFISSLCGAPTASHTTLAIRNKPVDIDDTGLVLGRWHIDSFRRQYKTFLFLTDVTESSGPFEYVPGTQRALFKARMAAAGHYFGFRGALQGKRRYSRLQDTLVANLGEEGYRPVPVTCPAGTVMIVDTSAIHRARPCRDRPRYALTAYFR